MSKTPSTALITGPTSGIGEEFAHQLAEVGYNLVLVSRNEEKLSRLSEQLAASHGIRTNHISADLSQGGAPKMVFDQTQALGVVVDLLVNNAGIEVYAPFGEADWEATHRLINLNVMALVDLTHLFLPGMLVRNAGHILNLGSIGSFVPGPNNAVYCASKAFVRSFSEAIAEELRGTKVGVTCLCPGAVRTAFMDQARLNETPLVKFTGMKPEPVAAAGILAMQVGKWVHVPGLINKLIVFLQRFSPRRLVTRISKWAFLSPEKR